MKVYLKPSRSQYFALTHAHVQEQKSNGKKKKEQKEYPRYDLGYGSCLPHNNHAISDY